MKHIGIPTNYHPPSNQQQQQPPQQQQRPFRSVLDYDTEDRIQRALLSTESAGSTVKSERRRRKRTNSHAANIPSSCGSGNNSADGEAVMTKSSSKSSAAVESTTTTDALLGQNSNRTTTSNMNDGSDSVDSDGNSYSDGSDNELDWVLNSYDPDTTEVQSMKEELKRLQVLKSYLILDSEREIEFDRITAMASRMFNVPMAVVSLVDLGRQWFMSNQGLPPDTTETPRKISFCAHTILQKSTVNTTTDDNDNSNNAIRKTGTSQNCNGILVVPDATNDLRFRTNPAVTGALNVRFYAGAPLVSPEGYKLGTLCIIDTKARPSGLSPDECDTLRDLACLTMKLMVDRRYRLQNIENNPAQLIACTAHDLMTPLTGVQLSLSLLNEDDDVKRILGSHRMELISNATLCSDIMLRICQTAMDGLRGQIPPSAATSAAVEDKIVECVTTSAMDPNYGGGGGITTTVRSIEGDIVSSSPSLPSSSLPITRMDDLIRSLHMLMDPIQKKVPIIITLDKSVPSYVVGDDLKLFRSALNLLSNAATRTNSGIIHLKIYPQHFNQSNNDESSTNNSIDDATACDVNNDHYHEHMLMFECEDTGTDIKVEEYQYLFQPNHHYGIGLSSVAQLINSMDGEYGFRPRGTTPEKVTTEDYSNVRTKDSKGRTLHGAIFWFSIPLYTPESLNVGAGSGGASTTSSVCGSMIGADSNNKSSSNTNKSNNCIDVDDRHHQLRHVSTNSSTNLNDKRSKVAAAAAAVTASSAVLKRYGSGQTVGSHVSRRNNNDSNDSMNHSIGNNSRYIGSKANRNDNSGAGNWSNAVFSTAPSVGIPSAIDMNQQSRNQQRVIELQKQQQKQNMQYKLQQQHSMIFGSYNKNTLSQLMSRCGSAPALQVGCLRNPNSSGHFKNTNPISSLRNSDWSSNSVASASLNIRNDDGTSRRLRNNFGSCIQLRSVGWDQRTNASGSDRSLSTHSGSRMNLFVPTSRNVGWASNKNSEFTDPQSFRLTQQQQHDRKQIHGCYNSNITGSGSNGSQHQQLQLKAMSNAAESGRRMLSDYTAANSVNNCESSSADRAGGGPDVLDVKRPALPRPQVSSIALTTGTAYLHRKNIDSNSNSREKSGMIAAAAVGQQQQHRRPRKALVIEDSTVVRKSLARALNRVGFVEVTQAVDGMEGLKELKEQLFDIVLCDFLMPVMDGLDCVKQYRAWEKVNRPWYRQLIIGISAHANMNDSGQGIEAGMDDFKPKPISIKTLTELQESGLCVARSEQLDELEGQVQDSIGDVSNSHSSVSYRRSDDLSKQSSKKASVHDRDNDFEKQQRVKRQCQAHVCLMATDTPTLESNEILTSLESAGWRVVVVHDGKDALRLLQMRNWDAVLIDDDISDVNGQTCISAFREWEERNRVNRQKNLFLVCDGDIPSPSDKSSVIQPPSGCNGVLRKPVPWKDLRYLLEQNGGLSSNMDIVIRN